jgi:3-hydroxy-9,10-secoandrosta-1,3,5(10)-triene-9,17-dione monooxygenase reductase component
VTEPQGRIHYENPFATPAELREPARRFRGRLAAPVTVWTSGGPGEPAGLTVSSLLVAEGQPPLVIGLISPTSDLWEAIRGTGRFVVHVLGEGNEKLAERFAGMRPSPGGLFVGLRTEVSEWGPMLLDFPNRALCTFQDGDEVGNQLMISGSIDKLAMTDFDEPLVYFRGRYRSARPRA